ncbi:hypothetical protein DAPPUDRAFT_255909 [Daphnia pulex]|uniref:Cullin-2 n=1 Tax=Daphnia pulex TaxID=6669 RepID=E9HAB9_DAPPU|nr:hypothetical protein DAPPUDRAFT_255909 [Daphnia pulex]|eukprot:EFX71319.1 hypothetical protein DAPPUDRAFT_255909 [Daphnia pulex]
MSLKPKRVDFTTTWADLKETVKGVVTLGNVPHTIWYNRFSDVYSLCVAYPEPLAEKLYQETKKFLEEHVKSLFLQVNGTSEEQLLTVYYTLWQQYSQGMDYLHKLYSYLNTQHIKKQKATDAELLYGTLSYESPEQMKEIGELVEEYKKKNTLELYEAVFEGPFLEATGEYYGHEASRLLQECTISLYMEKVLQRRDEEDLRSRKFLHPSSYSKVRSECEKRMVADHLAAIHNECPTMVQQELQQDLRNAYALLKSIPGGLTLLVSHVMEHIKQQGLRTVTNLSGDNIAAQFVEGMLSVHSKYKEITNTVFSNDQLFSSALDMACAAVVNHRLNTKQSCKSPELLAKYCDTLLRKSTRGGSDTEVDDKLTQCITVFKYIDDKDVYQFCYSRMLATRLIQQMSQSMDAEEAMINRLKQACGYEFTNKLHRMFTDMSVSSDLNNKFNLLNKDRMIELGLNFSIYVLQTGAWPRQVCPTDFAVPQELEKSVQEFEDFYRLQFNGRKLAWLHHLSYGELKLNYLKKRYFITMGTFQMAMLLVFQKTNSVTCGELMEATKLNSDQFQKALQSLVDSKLLAVTSATVEVFQPSTVISLNMDYSNKRTKFRINNTIQKETVQETETTHSSVNEDRKMYLQATIVRIMKSRKILRHMVLIQEVLSQSQPRFAPSIGMIKKCIEALIDKQYLERTPNSTDEYSYVA